ncbi:MAG: polysaccharide biosynthesis C-terminal domain-containing protein [Puniceicoccales bacterium]|nr:polysaccharide biosynthesis C-terminal domain-containing protein [Puniceicoccales bacterium]
MSFAKKIQIDASVSGILKIIIPLILSCLSSNLMFLIDRLILMRYSLDAMNAAMLGGNLAGVYVFLLMAITGTTEIFVGQYNGAGEYDKIAAPVWQMIYLVIFAAIFYIPIGYLSDYLNLIPECYAKDGIAYQRLLTYFCWMPGLAAAFTGFFIGRGQTKIITVIVVLGNLINAILDYLLVFGVKGIIPSLGCRGAAEATIIAEAIQILILAGGFWSSKNRQHFSTAKNYKFNKDMFRRCLKVGIPMSLGRGAELLAWYLVFAALSHESRDLATIHGIAMTVYVLIVFICDSLSKGTAAISANFIGKNDLASIGVILKKLTILTLIFCFIFMFPLLISPYLFCGILGTINEGITHLYPTLSIIFKIQFINITLESLCAIFWGTLASGGDTKYINITSLGCLWGFVVLPVALLYAFNMLNSAIIVHLLSTCWISSCLLLVYRRYKSLKWYKSVIH